MTTILPLGGIEARSTSTSLVRPISPLRDVAGVVADLSRAAQMAPGHRPHPSWPRRERSAASRRSPTTARAGAGRPRATGPHLSRPRVRGIFRIAAARGSFWPSSAGWAGAPTPLIAISPQVEQDTAAHLPHRAPESQVQLDSAGFQPRSPPRRHRRRIAGRPGRPWRFRKRRSS